MESEGGNKTIAFVLLLDRCLFKRIHQEMGARVTDCTRGNVGSERSPERDARDKAGAAELQTRGLGGSREGGAPKTGGASLGCGRRGRFPSRARAWGRKAAGQLSKLPSSFSSPSRIEIHCLFKAIAAATNRRRGLNCKVDRTRPCGWQRSPGCFLTRPLADRMAGGWGVVVGKAVRAIPSLHKCSAHYDLNYYVVSQIAQGCPPQNTDKVIVVFKFWTLLVYTGVCEWVANGKRYICCNSVL